MAKGNLIQGVGSGSLGDTIFYRMDGEQMSRIRNRRPYNPRTDSQMANRTIVANLSQAYSGMLDIVDHSYEGIPYGRKTMAAFLKENSSIARDAALADLEGCTWMPKGIQLPPVLPYKMSSGRLPRQSYKWSLVAGENEDGYPDSIYFETQLGKVDTASWNNPYTFFQKLNLNKGEMLTICFLMGSTEENRDKEPIYIKTRFVYCRIMRNNEDIPGTASGNPFLSNYINLRKSYLGVGGWSDFQPWYVKCQFVTDIDKDENKILKLTPVINDDTSTNWIMAFCVIKSAQVTNVHGRKVWQRSTEHMRLSDLSMPSGVRTCFFNMAMQTFAKGSEALAGSEYYLNGGH